MEKTRDATADNLTILYEDHFALARLHLHIGHCFSVLRRFEEYINNANVPYVLACAILPAVPEGIVASGAFVIRYAEDGPVIEIGRWAVRQSGNLDVSLGALDLSDSPYDFVDRMLSHAWHQGVITQAIKYAKQVEPK